VEKPPATNIRNLFYVYGVTRWICPERPQRVSQTEEKLILPASGRAEMIEESPTGLGGPGSSAIGRSKYQPLKKLGRKNGRKSEMFASSGKLAGSNAPGGGRRNWAFNGPARGGVILRERRSISTK